MKTSPKSPTRKPHARPRRLPDSVWRHNGNIARLPKPARDKVNQMIQDGFSYPAIIQALGDAGKGLSPSNFVHWRKGGYKDWVIEQAFIESTRARQETPAQMVGTYDATEVNHAALQLGTLHIFEALRRLGPGSLDKNLGGDCSAYARLLNALARASRETMMLQKYRDACARARAALEPMKDPRRKLTESERRAIVLHVDDILGLRQDDNAPFDRPQANGTSNQPIEPISEPEDTSPTPAPNLPVPQSPSAP